MIQRPQSHDACEWALQCSAWVGISYVNNNSMSLLEAPRCRFQPMTRMMSKHDRCLYSVTISLQHCNIPNVHTHFLNLPCWSRCDHLSTTVPICLLCAFPYRLDSVIIPVPPMQNKDVCPPMVCKISKGRKRVTWITCNNGEQWYHVDCVGLTAKSAQSINTLDVWPLHR